jgi:hypothetical protein
VVLNANSFADKGGEEHRPHFGVAQTGVGCIDFGSLSAMRTRIGAFDEWHLDFGKS